MRNITSSTFGLGTTTTWNGSSWNNGTPNVNMITRIAGNYTTVTHGSISCLDLFLDSGTIIISSNTYIRVNRNITQAAAGVTFSISSNGALALYNPNVDTTSIKVTISRTLPFNVARLDYRTLGDPIGGKTAQSLSTGTLANRIYGYDSVLNGYFTNYFYNTTTVGVDTASSKFTPGVGLLYRSPNTFPLTPTTWTITTNNVTVTGKLNSGVIRVPFQKSNSTNSFILLSNPYSAPIDMKKFMSVNSFLNGIVYEWIKSNSSISGYSYLVSNKYSPTIHTTSTSTLGVIGVFEGFLVNLVNATTSESSVIFTPDMMVIGEQFNLTDSFTINLKNPGIDLPEGRLCYTELRNPVNFSNLSSTLGNTSILTTTIGTSSYILYGDTTQRTSIDIDVYGTTSSSNLSLLSTFGRFTDATITLQDLTLNTTQNLKISSYTFSTVVGTTYSGRFKINIT